MKIPESLHAGTLMIGNWVFRCHVLNNNLRLISVVDFFDSMDVAVNKRHLFIKYLNDLSHHPAVTTARLVKIAKEINEPIIFRNNQSIAYGYEAATFVDFCTCLLDLRRSGIEMNNDEKTRADIAERLMVSLANIGLVALIDEATGFQQLRPRDALQILLDKYLRKELAAWAKVFPDEFYLELFRLKGWEWKGMKVNRPQVVGHYTRDIVYERLAPGVVDELQKRNPTHDDGKRAAKHHQWLTEDIGHPALAQHLHAVIGLMRASTSWASFMRLLDRAFPRRGATLELPIDLD